MQVAIAYLLVRQRNHRQSAQNLPKPSLRTPFSCGHSPRPHRSHRPPRPHRSHRPPRHHLEVVPVEPAAAIRRFVQVSCNQSARPHQSTPRVPPRRSPCCSLPFLLPLPLSLPRPLPLTRPRRFRSECAEGTLQCVAETSARSHAQRQPD